MNLRPLGTADLDAIDSLRPKDWLPYRQTFAHYLRTSCCQPWGLVDGPELLAMGTWVDFGRSARIAQLITAPQARGQGLASKLMEFFLSRAQKSGTETVTLVATEVGYPLYEKFGFHVDGWFQFWDRVKDATTSPSSFRRTLLRPWTADDLEATRTLDRLISGEDRWPYWRLLIDDAVVAESPDAPGQVHGLWLPRLGEGAIWASTVDAGRSLLTKKLGTVSRCVVPDENTLAAEVLQTQGFRPGIRARRMTWGKPLARRFDLMWSRVGGNLG